MDRRCRTWRTLVLRRIALSGEARPHVQRSLRISGDLKMFGWRCRRVSSKRCLPERSSSYGWISACAFNIAEADRNIAAETAQIGVATAAYFPQLSLTALVGYESTNAVNRKRKRMPRSAMSELLSKSVVNRWSRP